MGKRGRGRWALLVAVSLLTSCGEEQPPAEAPGSRLVVIGLAGLDATRARSLMEQGRMPHLTALRARGAMARVMPPSPPLPPLVWTTLATGRTPDRHGVLEFVPGDEAGRGHEQRRPRVKTLWEVAADSGLVAAAVGWWSTWPVRDGGAMVVSDRWATAGDDTPLTDLTMPAALQARLQAVRVAAPELTAGDMERFLPLSAVHRRLLAGSPIPVEAAAQPLLSLRRIVAATRSTEAAAGLLLREEEPDLLLVGFDGVDQVQHLFARYEEPALPGTTAAERRRYGGVVDSFYRYQDEVVGRLAAAAGPEAAVVVVSAHGFARGSRRPTAEPVTATGSALLWHDGAGLLLLAGPPFSAADLGAVRLVDVTPTLAAVLGLPLAEDLSGSPLRGALTSPFLGVHPITTIDSYERQGRRLGAHPAADDRPGPGLGPQGHVNLATVLSHQGRVEEARQAYEAALTADPGWVPAHLGLFDLLEGKGAADEALAAGENCLARAYRPPTEVYPRVARLWVAAGRIEAGRAFLEEHPGPPGEPGPWLARALLAQGAGDDAAALDALQRALERDPGSWDVARALVAHHERSQRLQDAIPALRRGLAARGGDSLPHLVALGYCSLAADDLAAAGDYLGRAVEIAPRQEEALYYLGSVHFRSGRYSEAVRNWSRLVEVAPGHVDGRAHLILALARTGRIARALEVFRAAGPEGRKSLRLLSAAASACLLNGLAEEGLRLARRALELAPQDEEINRLVAALQAEAVRTPPAEDSP